MENNVVMGGIEGDTGKNEKCVNNVLNFLQNKMKIEAKAEEILVAHCSKSTGKTGTAPRNMIVRCTVPLKEHIFKNLKNLKDVKNKRGESYSINKQLPDVLAEQNRQIREKIKGQRQKDEGRPKQDCAKIEVKDKEVYINGELSRSNYLLQVEPLDLFPNKQEKAKWNALKMSMSDVKTEGGSNFIAMAVKVNQFADVKRAYHKAYSLYPSSNHIVATYKLRNGYEGYQDDNEHGAGHKLLKELKDLHGSVGTAVFIVRTYDGSHIGQIRHTIMAEVMKQAITRLEKENW